MSVLTGEKRNWVLDCLLSLSLREFLIQVEAKENPPYEEREVILSMVVKTLASSPRSTKEQFAHVRVSHF